jgi:hypothetical protein
MTKVTELCKNYSFMKLEVVTVIHIQFTTFWISHHAKLSIVSEEGSSNLI